MAFIITDSLIGPKQAITSIVSTTPTVPVGTIVRAKDPLLGAGEFIYLPTTASVTQFNVVQYVQTGVIGASAAYKVVRAPNAATGGYPVAIAQATGVAACFGWFQIAGTSPVLKTAVTASAGKPAYISATAGRIKMLASAGRGVVGLLVAGKGNAAGSAVSAGVSTVFCTFSRPSVVTG